MSCYGLDAQDEGRGDAGTYRKGIVFLSAYNGSVYLSS